MTEKKKKRGRGRPVDPEKQALLVELGQEGSKRNWTKKELLERKAALQRRAEQKQQMETQVEAITGPDPEDETPATLAIPYDLREQEKASPFSGLTERQRMVAKLRMRGMSQSAIANILGLSQPAISHELKAIRDWQISRGADVHQAEVVGATATLYEEVEYKGWELFHEADKDGNLKAKALGVIMQARDKHTKLLMELGLLRKAAVETKLTVEASPLVKSWKDGDARKQFADAVVVGQLPPLADPEPDVVDVDEYEEEDSDEEE